MQYGFVPEGGIINVMFILKRLQEESHAKVKKLYVGYSMNSRSTLLCFENSFFYASCCCC